MESGPLGAVSAAKTQLDCCGVTYGDIFAHAWTISLRGHDAPCSNTCSPQNPQEPRQMLELLHWSTWVSTEFSPEGAVKVPYVDSMFAVGWDRWRP